MASDEAGWSESALFITSPEPLAQDELLWSLDVRSVSSVVCRPSSTIASNDISS